MPEQCRRGKRSRHENGAAGNISLIQFKKLFLDITLSISHMPEKLDG